MLSAILFSAKINENDLADAWAGHIGYTWKRGKTQSRLDKIYTRISQYTNKKMETNWTLTKSDHAAVILTLEHRKKILRMSTSNLIIQ